MTAMTLADAGRRFSQVAGALAASPDAGAMRTGFAQLLDDDAAGELIARADSELLDSLPGKNASEVRWGGANRLGRAPSGTVS